MISDLYLSFVGKCSVGNLHTLTGASEKITTSSVVIVRLTTMTYSGSLELRFFPVMHARTQIINLLI